MSNIFWYDYNHSMRNALDTSATRNLQAQLELLTAQKRDLEDTIRANWFMDQISSCAISVEPENGSTKALFGSDILISAIEDIMGNKCFVLNTVNGDVCIGADNHVALMENGTLKFSIGDKMHYLCINRWKELLNTKLYAGLSNF